MPYLGKALSDDVFSYKGYWTKRAMKRRKKDKKIKMTNKSVSNGYIVMVDHVIYGPFASYDDAVNGRDKMHNQNILNKSFAIIKEIRSAPLTLNVKECDRPECRHCPHMERGADNFHNARHNERMNNLEYKSEYEKATEEIKNF